MAKDLAQSVKYRHIDSGAMYRAVTLFALNHNLFIGNRPDEKNLRIRLPEIQISFRYNPETGKSDTFLNGQNVEKEIRTMAVSEKVSHIAQTSFVRKALVSRQREMGKTKGIIMDGRDIGTVVFPEAELKIFVTARPEVRAGRRLEELTARGENASFAEVLANLAERDRIDATRSDSPLRRAQDAVILDNSLLTIPEQNAILLKLFMERTG